MTFKELLKNKFVFLDGAMGTMLQKAGLKTGDIPELLNLTNPEVVIDIHKQYINAGSNIIYANTFGANGYKLKGCGHSVDEVIGTGIRNAKKACEGTDTLVALDIGPIGQLLEPTGSLTFEQAYDIFKEQIEAGRDADLIVFETMTDLYEVKAAVLAAKENSGKPIIVTMTFEENRRTFTGCSVSAMALALQGLGVDAIGINCSLGPKELLPVVEDLYTWLKIPLAVKPNAGLPDPATGAYNITKDEFADYVAQMAKFGLKIVGGCCGTDPDFIRATVERLKNVEPTFPKTELPAALCSYSNTVLIDRPRIIGERINPTGKKLLKEALKNDDINYILNLAISQAQAGADLLDVNVGLPGIDEKEMMKKAVKAVQGVTDLPLQIDSTIPEVLEAGLRVYNGKALVNSVNGEEESLEKILPIVKKYGAAVLGLALDENGIPPKAEQRFEIAKKIMERALAIGIPKEDIYIDCLCLTASAQQEAVMETLKAIKMVKENLGLKTVLGVSNISFGLPQRGLVNSTFLTMAMSYGLDLGIINPNIKEMTGAVRAFRLLKGYDKNSVDFIEAYSEVEEAPKQTASSTEMTLDYAIHKGLKEDARRITEKLLETQDSMEVVNGIIVPALDSIGALFEKGKIFLPQLILSAGVAQEAFEVIKKKMIESNNAPVSKGKVILATVKGDIHDIGKNIVKVLLENYGYTVVDLGKDVPYEAVVEAVIEHDAKLVGLSALMTTTLVSMAETIELIRQNQLDCEVVVGGAVLTPDYAKEIGADYYAKDAKETVDIAKKVLG
ncbi:MAG: homocysteine S-methyltransferase family protein [Firmicutes bacterium]|nr:homocysteine S-methyltransferase family protein [Bacillota bacterium]